MEDGVIKEKGATIMSEIYDVDRGSDEATTDKVMTEADVTVNSLGVQPGSLVGISDDVVTDSEAEVKSLGVQVGALEGVGMTLLFLKLRLSQLA